MSTPTTLQGKLVPMAISTDGNTYKNVVCKKLNDLKADTNITTEETDCGPLVSLGTLNWSFSFEGVYNSTFASATEMSSVEISNLVISQALCYVKVQSGAIYFQGSGYLTNFAQKFDANALVSFTCTFTGQGVLDNTP
jgi:hypothetical protein